jgi:hypothetical protein
VNVRVTTLGGQSAIGAGNQFTYSAPLGPTISNLNPNTGAAGTSVVITGTLLTGATGVSFGGVPATSFVVNSATQITAVAPAGSGTENVTVTTPDGTSNPLAFTYPGHPAYFGPFGAAAGNPSAFMALGGTPDEALILAIASNPPPNANGGTLANPVSGSTMNVPNVPGNFGYIFAYPASLPPAASLINIQTSIDVLSAQQTMTLTIGGESYRVYWTRPTAPVTAATAGHTMTIG